MPSTLLTSQSGGIGLVSGNLLSGAFFAWGGVQLKLDFSGAGPVAIELPFVVPTNLSGYIATLNSGGGLSSGGLQDGFPMAQGDAYFIPKARLVSGIETIRVQVPAASSGTRLFWEPL